MKYCPECGLKLKNEPTIFCIDCGYNISKLTSNNTRTSMYNSNTFTNIDQANESEIEDFSIDNKHEYNTIHNLGVKLEELVEKILKNKGFSTQRRLKLKGRSGALHEIDVFAQQKNQVIAVECKNYNQDRIVGIKEIRDFQSKLNDLHHNDDAIFVTSAKFSSDAETYAKKYAIELWDGYTLSKIYLSVLIGRSTPADNYKSIMLDAALPLTMTYEEITNLKLENLSMAHITGTLILRPYYLIDYKVDSLIIDKRGKTHRLKAEGKYIVDAITEHTLYTSESPGKDPNRYLSKRYKDDLEQEEELIKIEQNQIINDLLKIDHQVNLKIKESEDYSLKIHQPKLSTKTVKYTILEKIIEKNTKEIIYNVRKSKDQIETKSITITPKKNDIDFRKLSLIYVPIWRIEIQSKTITYRRRAFAASGTITLDEIAICPKDFSTLKIWTKKKLTHALYDTCGIALCVDHIHKHNEKYYCKDHNK